MTRQSTTQRQAPCESLDSIVIDSERRKPWKTIGSLVRVILEQGKNRADGFDFLMNPENFAFLFADDLVHVAHWTSRKKGNEGSIQEPGRHGVEIQAQKSGPISGATILKRQKGGKSGKTLQGVVLTNRATIRKLSRTMSCGEGHGAVLRPLLLFRIQHLPRQRNSSHRVVTSITLTCCAGVAYKWKRILTDGLGYGACR